MPSSTPNLLIDREKWGKCKWTEPRVALTSDDMVWLEKGHMPRKLWWDAECNDARKLARQAERAYRKCHARLLDKLKRGIGKPLTAEEADAQMKADKAKKDALLARARALREMMRRKERTCRLHRRRAMLEDRRTREFWRQVAAWGW